ncbi:MAG: hypothetical protein CSA81_04320 [Acidobacteria bacterium]|nr:MAG: hypothetical protein CSA81_04320 [Acidobacteriota bacterium]
MPEKRKSTTPVKLATINFMQHFQCIGSDCEDTCCRMWEIGLDKGDFDNLNTVLRKKESMQAYINAYSRTRDRKDIYGVINLDAKMSCRLLTDGLCMIHRDFGEEYIPKVCATFPRTLYKTSVRTELNGNLACPEVARLCLLHPDPPAFMEAVATPVNPQYSQNNWPVQGQEPYRKHLFSVRNSLLRLFANENFTLAQKHYACLYLAYKTHAFLRLDIAENQETRLERLLKRLHDGYYTERAIQAYNRLPLCSPSIQKLVIAFLCTNLDTPQFHRLNALLDQAFQTANLDRRLFDATNTAHHRVLLENLYKSRALILDRFAARVEKYFTNMTLNIWSQIVWMGSSSLHECCQKAITSVFFARLLFFLHRDAVQAVKLEDAEALPLLNKAVVETVQTVMRNIHANATLQETILNSMQKLSIQTLDELGSLLKL